MGTNETEKYTELPISQESIDYLDVEIKRIHQDIVSLMIFPNPNAQAAGGYNRYLQDVASATKSRMIELLEKRTRIIETYLLNVNDKLILTEYDNGGRIIIMCRKRFEDIMDNKINGDGEKLEELSKMVDS